MHTEPQATTNGSSSSSHAPAASAPDEHDALRAATPPPATATGRHMATTTREWTFCCFCKSFKACVRWHGQWRCETCKG
jgi:hypothetical protein